MNNKITFVLALALITTVNLALAECFGEGEYRVCSDSYTDSDGDIHMRSWDSEGNTYNIDTESYTTPEGSSTRSHDSEGNEYSIRSWSDSAGYHSEDSEGNRCTITRTGQMIGCD